MAGTASIQGMGRAVRPPARCRRGQAKQAAQRSARTRGDGFLSHSFKPVWAFEGNRARAEKEFFRSLAHLREYYGLLNLDTWPVAFPQNIYSAWQTARNELHEIDKNTECYIIGDEKRQAVLATAVTLPFSGLHCIPVRPFWYMSHRADKQAEAETLLHLFAYLNQQAGIPFYQEADSFMDEQYDNLQCLINDMQNDTDDEEEIEYRECQNSDLYELRQAGAHMMPLLHNPALLTGFHKIIERNLSAIPEELATIAAAFAELYRTYPENHVYQNINTELQNPFGEEAMRPDQYLSFYWSAVDELCETLDEYVNCAFENLSIIEEPAEIIVFDRLPQQPKQPPLDYERRLFKLMDELRDYLEEQDYGKYNRAL